jgi:hypothetical protein
VEFEFLLRCCNEVVKIEDRSLRMRERERERERERGRVSLRLRLKNFYQFFASFFEKTLFFRHDQETMNERFVSGEFPTH